MLARYSIRTALDMPGISSGPRDMHAEHDILVIVFARMRITDGKGGNEQRQRITGAASTRSLAGSPRALSPLICLPGAAPRCNNVARSKLHYADLINNQIFHGPGVAARLASPLVRHGERGRVTFK